MTSEIVGKYDDKIYYDESVRDFLQHTFVLPGKPHRRERVAKEILKCLQEDFRMTLTRMSKKTQIPISTLFDSMKLMREYYDWHIVFRLKDNGGEKD